MSSLPDPSFYERFYSSGSHDSESGLTSWRLLSAKYKALNIQKAVKNISSLANILEVGSGTGELAHLLFSLLTTAPIHISDISATALAHATLSYPEAIASTTLLQISERLPFDDNQYDLVICSHVLEHVPNISQFLSELLRVGRLVYIEVPLDYRHFYIPTPSLLSCGHIHAFSNSTIRFYIEQSGCKVLHSGTSFIQHKYRISNFDLLSPSSRHPSVQHRFRSLLSVTKWCLMFCKLRLRAFLGTYGTEAYFLVEK